LGAVASIKARLGWKGLKASEYVDEGFIFLSTPNIKGPSIDFDNVDYISARRYYESPEIILRNGDVLIAKDGSTLGTANVVRSLPAPATVNSSIAVVRPAEALNSLYCFYFLTSHYTQSMVGRMKDGMGVPHLFQADLRKFTILLPPGHEQVAIARFLDRETAMIDAIIERKERLITLLEEKRAALIDRAVTKGVNQDALMKDSGIPWLLGGIPDHWDVRRLGRLFRERDERGHPDLPLLTVSLNTGVTVREFSESRIERVADDPATYKRAASGDVVFNKMRMWQGAVGVAPSDGLVSPDYVVARALPDVHVEFFAHVFRTRNFKGEVNRFSHGIVPDRNRLYWDQFKQLTVPFPPVREQAAILREIERRTESIDSLTNRINRVINLLQEYRTALISAAVTGRIDVRGFARV
jgi:type I restriction enzyme S subunit